MKKFTDIITIAEVGLAHDGSYALAASYIHSAKKAGADCVKFQTHDSESESSAFDQFRVKSKFFDDKTRQEFWTRTSFSKEQWIKLKNLTEKLGMFFISSPFSVESAKFLNSINVKAWKVGSGELSNYPLLDYLSETKKPIILSTGLSNYKEISETLKIIKKTPNIILMQCTSLYPCPTKLIGLNVIQEMKKKFNLKIGFSDHSGDPGIGIAAFSMGACMIETHVSYHKEIQTFDSSSSLNFEEFAMMCKTLKKLKLILNNKYDKNEIITKLKKNKILFEKSIYLNKNKLKYSTIHFNDMTFKKPAIGIHSKYYKKIIGRKLNKNIYINQLLKFKDLI